MSTASHSSDVDQALSKFQGLSVDEQLAFLWYVYEKMGESITPAAPGAASGEISHSLSQQVEELEMGEPQLEVMRDIASGKDTRFSRSYGSLDDNTKLAFWYALAQGMEGGTIVPMPEDYTASDATQQLLGSLESMDQQQQITILRDAVLPMGAEAKQGTV